MVEAADVGIRRRGDAGLVRGGGDATQKGAAMIADVLCDVIERRALNPESQTFNLNDPLAWDTFASGATATTGVKVTDKRALGLAAFWAGVDIISQDVAKLPLQVLARDGDGKRRANEHPAYRLLRRQPNEFMTAFTFKQVMTAHRVYKGNAYAYIERNRATYEPVSLLPLDPTRTFPLRVNGRLWYATKFDRTGSDGAPIAEERKIPGEDILHLKGLGFDGLVGYDVVTYHRDTLGLALAARDFGARFFKNDAAPGVVFELPQGVKMAPADAERFIAKWKSMHEGVDRQHRAAVLPMGMAIKPFTARVKDNQLVELMGMDIRTIAALLRLPPHKLGDTTRTGYNSLSEENQDYYNTLNSHLIPWEEECAAKLLSTNEIESDSHLVEFLREALLQTDIKTQREVLEIDFRNGAIDIDEWRNITNRNPLPDGRGKVRMVPMNFQPVDVLAEQQNRLAETGDGQADTNFKRDVIRAFIADPTIADVIYNLTDIEDLITSVGLPPEKKMEAPFLPVIATPGPLVTGETIKDSEGDIVGGDIDEAVVDSGGDAQQPNEHPSDDPAKQAGDAIVAKAGEIQGTALNGAQVSSLLEIATLLATGQIPFESAKALIQAAFPLMTPEQIDAIVGPLKSFAPDAPAEPQAAPAAEPADPDERTLLAVRGVLSDAYRRMSQRLGNQAVRASRKGGKAFFDWANRAESEHRAAIVSAMGPVASLMAAVGRDIDAETLTTALLGGFAERMLAACECKEDELQARVAATCKQIETDMGPAIDRFVMVQK